MTPHYTDEELAAHDAKIRAEALIYEADMLDATYNPAIELRVDVVTSRLRNRAASIADAVTTK